MASKAKVWTGRILSVVAVLMLLLSASGKVMKSAQVLQGFAEFGYRESVVVAIGITEILCTLLYVIPRTSVLGAIVLTGYLGGAVATHLRIGDPKFIAPAIVGVVVWGGLYLRDERVRALIPLLSKGQVGDSL